jgi:hypothetical protein
MPDLLLIALPFVAALGSGVLSFIVAQARMEAAATREREGLIETRAQLLQQQKTMEEKVRTAEAEARRKAFDDFLADVRVEERHYVRQVGSAAESRKCLVLQERVCFRNIPLSQWIERELAFEHQGAGVAPVEPTPRPVAVPSPAPRRRLLR